MKSLVITCFIASVILMAGPVGATTYYYDRNAGGTESGLSWVNAFVTVAQINANMSGGDTCYLVDTLRGTIVPPSGGTYGDNTAYIAGNGVDNTPTLGGAWCFGGDNLTDSSWDDYSIYIDSCSYTPTWEHSRIGQAYLVTIDDSLTVPVTSIGALDAPGKSFHDEANHVLYIWTFDSSPVSGHEIEASAAPAAYLDYSGSGDHTVFYGITFKYGNHALFEWGYQNYRPDSLTLRACSLMFVSGVASQNIATIRAVGTNDTDSSHNGHWNRMVSCYFNHINNTGWPANNEHFKGISIYAESFFTVDSCEFGPDLGTGIGYKTNLGGAISAGNKARYNVFKGGGWAGIEIYCWAAEDSVYGNLFYGGSFGNGCNVGVMIKSLASIGNHFVANNSFYNCLLATDYGFEGPTNGANQCKYNVVYSASTSNRTMRCYNTDTLTWAYDSNMYYPQAYEDFEVAATGRQDMTLAQWQTWYNFDLNSTGTVDPGYDSVTTAANKWFGFARSNCDSLEIDSLEYGGKIWTQYGAVQPAVEATVDTAIVLETGVIIGTGTAITQ